MEKTFKGGLGVVDCRFTFGTHLYQRRLWDLELSSIAVVSFTMNRVILTTNVYLIVDLFIFRLVPVGTTRSRHLVFAMV